MKSKKISDVIKNVLEVTDGVLGRPATRTQVLQVIELIESFDPPAKPEPKVTVITKVKRSKPKPRKGYVSWRKLGDFFDALLDGDVHVLPYSDFTSVVPKWQTLKRSSVRERFYVEAKARGFNNATVKFEDSESSLLIQANK